MDPNASKLRHRHQIDEQTTHHAPQRELTTVEEVIRSDVAQTIPPEAIAQRLADSIAREPRSARSWWRRWFT